MPTNCLLLCLYADTAVLSTEEEDEISALLTASIELNSKSVEITPEDTAWVDSCLVSDPQMSDESWDALREALLQTVTAQVEPDDEQPSNAQLNENAQENEEEEEETNEYAQVEQIEDEGDGGDTEGNEESLLGSQQDIESRDNIFKVWELEALEEEDEENELIKQLKKALTVSKFQSDKVLEEDELVAGMGELSLEPPPESS